MAGFDGAEGADELLVRLQATAAGSTHSFRGRMEHTLFRLLGLMLEGRAKGQTASRRRAGVAWFSLALFLIDWLQLLSLVLSPKFGWPISFMNFLQAFSITSLLSLQSSTVSVFGTYLGVSLALQVVSLVLAAWGMYSVYSGFSGTLLPIKVRRGAPAPREAQCRGRRQCHPHDPCTMAPLLQHPARRSCEPS